MQLLSVSVKFEKQLLYFVFTTQANTSYIVFSLENIERMMMGNFRLIFFVCGGTLIILRFFSSKVHFFISIIESCTAS